MEIEAEDGVNGQRAGERTLSTMSQQSSQGSKFPLISSDSGLYTCSSSNSECLESDTDSYHLRECPVPSDALQLTLHEAQKLRSELERLTKSEQWYKQELRNLKSTRLVDLERIYTQERKCILENQRLQKECVRLYDKCSELEGEVEKQRKDQHVDYAHIDGQLEEGENVQDFEVQQQSTLIKDQQLLISVLRNQKKALLADLRTLGEDKDERVVEMQRLLADLEFDNKQITKKCADLSKERSRLVTTIKQKDAKLSGALDENLNLQKTLNELGEQLEIQEKLIRLKEGEVEQIKDTFRKSMQSEQDLDEVHRLSVNYHEEIVKKSLEIKTLKKQLSEMQHEMDNLHELRVHNDHQQRLVDQLRCSLETCKFELQEMKLSDTAKSSQLEDLQKDNEKLLKDKFESCKQQQRQQMKFEEVYQQLKITKEQYALVQEKYKETQFKLELLEIDQGKLKFEKYNDQQEILHLRQKLAEYLLQISNLSKQMQKMETDLTEAAEENATLRHDFKKLQRELKTVGEQSNFDWISTETEDKFRKDFEKIAEECERLQSNLDIHNAMTALKSTILPNLEDSVAPSPEAQNQCTYTQTSSKDDELSALFCKLQEYIDLFRSLLKEKDNIIISAISAEKPNGEMENLVNDNIENPAIVLQLNRDLNDIKLKSSTTADHLVGQNEEVSEFQQQLLKKDTKAIKIERQMEIIKLDNTPCELQEVNQELSESLGPEQMDNSESKTQLLPVCGPVSELKDKLEQASLEQIHQNHKGVQYDNKTPVQVEQLKTQPPNLNAEHHLWYETESQSKNDRIQLLHKLSDMQSSKIQVLANSQKDWEEMLQYLNTALAKEEESQMELELKRRELEALNHVFDQQNEELKKLEELTALIEYKRRQETKKLKETFQQEMCGMRQELQESRAEAKEQRALNLKLKNTNEKLQKIHNENCVTDVSEYKNEIQCLKSKVERSLRDKDDLLERTRELEEELKDIKNHRRHAVVVPELKQLNCTDVDENRTNLLMLEGNVSPDHLRVLTKVLEAEYDRKMQRYDQHIHSLLSNVKSLKKTLRLNEEKTNLLEEEQSRTLNELKDLQRAKRKYEDMRLKYEQGQNTVEELKETLILERKKFESCDLGKSSQSQQTTYEVSNLIDDYKKLIQQSAAVTKRPTTCAVLDLIQRSNECVPNLHNIETSLVDLSSDIQNFLSLHTQKKPVRSLINMASLTMPSSLMDELRSASEGY